MTPPERADELPRAAPKDYWARNLRLTGLLLAVWFTVTFVLTFFARELSFSFFGWPFSFWVGAQGALLVYLLVIGIYARVMNRLDGDGDEAAKEPGGG